MGIVTGFLIIRYYRRIEQPNLPVPFGSNMAWMAIETTDTIAVAEALGFKGINEVPWGEGVQAAHEGAVFVTPPVGDWTLALGGSLFFASERTTNALRSLLVRLGQRFRDVQYFSNLRDVNLFALARVRRGRLVRAYSWLGSQNRTLLYEGSPTKEEQDLGFRVGEGQPPRIDLGEGSDPTPFTEDFLLHLANQWSIDPMTLNSEFFEPELGRLGRLQL